MGSTTNLTPKDEKKNYNPDEQQALESIMRKYKSIEQRPSRENSTEKLSILQQKSLRTNKSRLYDSEQAKKYYNSAKYNEYSNDATGNLQDLFQKLNNDSKTSQNNMYDNFAIEDSSNISFNKDDTYNRVLSDTTTNLALKDDFVLRSFADQSFLHGNNTSKVSKNKKSNKEKSVKSQQEKTDLLEITNDKDKDANLDSKKSSCGKNKWIDRSNNKKNQRMN